MSPGAALIDGDDEQGNDLVTQRDAVSDGFGSEQLARLVVSTPSLASRAQGVAQKLDVFPAFDTATKALVNDSTD